MRPIHNCTLTPIQHYHHSQLMSCRDFKCSFGASAVKFGIKYSVHLNCRAAAKLMNMKLIQWRKYLTYNKTASKAVCVYGCSIYSFWDQHKVLELAEMLAAAGISVALTGGYQAVANKVFSNCFSEKMETKQSADNFLFLHTTENIIK